MVIYIIHVMQVVRVDDDDDECEWTGTEGDCLLDTSQTGVGGDM